MKRDMGGKCTEFVQFGPANKCNELAGPGQKYEKPKQIINKRKSFLCQTQNRQYQIENATQAQWTEQIYLFVRSLSLSRLF